MDQFKQLYTKYEKQIFNYLFFLSGDTFIAEELTQETFFQILKSVHRFKGHSRISTWMYQIAKYTFYQYVRTETRTENTLIDSSISNNETPEHIYEKKEELTDVVRAIRKLKQPQQDVIILRAYNELSFKQIGEIFHQFDTWARVTFYRAKIKLYSIINGGE